MQVALLHAWDVFHWHQFAMCKYVSLWFISLHVVQLVSLSLLMMMMMILQVPFATSIYGLIGPNAGLGFAIGEFLWMLLSLLKRLYHNVCIYKQCVCVCVCVCTLYKCVCASGWTPCFCN